MNLANKLTLSRIIIIPIFVALILADNWAPAGWPVAVARWIALALFIAATITDYYDGVIARREGTVSNFGQLMDPLADKLIAMSAFVALVEVRLPSGQPVFPAWAVILILAREFLVTGLRSLATMQGRVIAADRWGKHKTGWQLGGIIGILAAMSLRDTLSLAGVDMALPDRVLPYLYFAVLMIIVCLTVMSGYVYLMNNRDLLREHR
jgi:CDP-diacylglycerol--glycerol-3-phosphate 3-phosphatidyltransferase